jgi:hypothetical protein
VIHALVAEHSAQVPAKRFAAKLLAALSAKKFGFLPVSKKKSAAKSSVAKLFASKFLAQQQNTFVSQLAKLSTTA